MASRPDPAGWRTRHLAKLAGAPEPVPAAVTEARAVINARNTVRNAQRRRALTGRQWKSVVARFGNTCVYCGGPLADKGVNRDHFIPLKLGGTLSAGNVVPAHPKCNRQKHDKHPLEFMVDRGRLKEYVEIVNYLAERK